jgi:NRPS condensation-like uncharacterized protein
MDETYETGDKRALSPKCQVSIRHHLPQEESKSISSLAKEIIHSILAIN